MAIASPKLKLKDPQGKLDYSITWSDWLAEQPTPGDFIVASTWALVRLETNALEADLLISGMTLQVLDFAQLGSDNATVTVTVRINGVAVVTVLVEGTDWTAATSDDATATSLAAAIDLISGVSATASTDTVTVTRDGIEITSQGFAAESTTVWLKGGVVGAEYELTNHVTTDDGREDDCTFFVRIEQQ